MNDRIEKCVTLRASRARVWRALTVATEFGQWFGVKLEGEFAEGVTVQGRITHPADQHLTMELKVERIEPSGTSRIAGIRTRSIRRFTDSSETEDARQFRLDDADEGIVLTIVESGFEQIPASRLLKRSA
ncbi:MAG: SRPBCC domain-containing protein [Vicinamibacterales bacterium]